jgi:twitching motility two-component system response regulator PilH
MARILVVDDVRFISQMLKIMFEEKGHRVTTASSGQEALAKAREEQPELILTDIAMPQMDGIEMTKLLKADNATKYIPVIIISAKNDKATIGSAYAAGAADFTVKPFNNEELLSKVGELLGGHRMNFSIDVTQGIPVVTVLIPEFEEKAMEQFRQAIESARGGGGRPMVLDFSRVRKVPPRMTDIVLTVQEELESQGGRVAVVVPNRALGMKTVLGQISPRVKIHESVDSAIEDIHRSLAEAGHGHGRHESGTAKHESGATKHEGAPTKHEGGPTRIKDAKRGVVVEAREDVTLVWIHRKDFGDDVLEFLSDILPKSSTNVYIDCREIREVTPSELKAVGQLIKRLKSHGRALYFVNPNEQVEEILKKSGYGSHITRMDSSGSPGGTRASTGAPS